MIDKNTYIEDLVEEVPASVKYLMEQGIKCIACGEPIWGTLEEAAREKGFDDKDIKKFVRDLNSIGKSDTKNEPRKRIDTKRFEKD